MAATSVNCNGRPGFWVCPNGSSSQCNSVAEEGYTTSGGCNSPVITSLIPPPQSQIEIVANKSLIVHDVTTLDAAGISLELLLTQLANQLNSVNSGDQITFDDLFRRMWDTQNEQPGDPNIPGPKCTNFLNGFPIECRPIEGEQAGTPVNFIGNYRPIALVNRFDLRDKVSFNNCGEARVIYALNGSGRNFIIFEAQLPNPLPGSAAGCSNIANFWADLSETPSPTERGRKLNEFYFDGIAASSVGPVIHANNFAQETGQIRVNMFMERVWLLKEFKLATEDGKSIVKPVTVKSNPFGPLFDPNRGDTSATNFRADFINNIDTLLGDQDTFFLKVTNDAHNNGQSHASGNTSENKYSTHLGSSSSSFRAAIENEISGSGLTVDQVINRATAMTCGGCHQPSAFGLLLPNSIGPGLSWPNTLGFVHVDERLRPGQTVFSLSEALNSVFLPARKTDLEMYLNNPPSNSSASGNSNKSGVVRITGKRAG